MRLLHEVFSDFLDGRQNVGLGKTLIGVRVGRKLTLGRVYRFWVIYWSPTGDVLKKRSPGCIPHGIRAAVVLGYLGYLFLCSLIERK